MTNPKNNTKTTGDTHLAEIESDLPIEGGSPIGLGSRGMQSSRVGNAVKKAGVITDVEADAKPDEGAASKPPSDGSGHSR